MPEKNQDEKDKEELERRRLQDILENKNNLFNMEVLVRFQRQENQVNQVLEQVEKLKKGVNQLLIDTEELLKSKEVPKELELPAPKKVEKKEEVKDEDDDEPEETDDEEDDLGYERKI